MVEARDDQAVAPEVAVEGLIVIDGAGVFRPQLDLVEMELGRAEVALGGVNQIGMDGQPVEVR